MDSSSSALTWETACAVLDAPESAVTAPSFQAANASVCVTSSWSACARRRRSRSSASRMSEPMRRSSSWYERIFAMASMRWKDAATTLEKACNTSSGRYDERTGRMKAQLPTNFPSYMMHIPYVEPMPKTRSSSLQISGGTLPKRIPLMESNRSNCRSVMRRYISSSTG